MSSNPRRVIVYHCAKSKRKCSPRPCRSKSKTLRTHRTGR